MTETTEQKEARWRASIDEWYEKNPPPPLTGKQRAILADLFAKLR